MQTGAPGTPRLLIRRNSLGKWMYFALSCAFLIAVWSMCISGDYEGAIREHQQELALSEVLSDVIGRAVANRKIGECYAEMGNIEAALKVSIWNFACFLH